MQVLGSGYTSGFISRAPIDAPRQGNGLATGEGLSSVLPPVTPPQASRATTVANTYQKPANVPATAAKGPPAPTGDVVPAGPGPAAPATVAQPGETGEPGRAAPTGEAAESVADGQQKAQQQAEFQEIAQLKARDREVRAHEAAHAAVGGQYAGAPSYTFSRGPDGVRYAVGGEVSIDVAPVSGDPQATIEKMRTVRAAALAPAEPSSQDRAVAQQAAATEAQARAELAARTAETAKGATATPDSKQTAQPDAAESGRSAAEPAGASSDRSALERFQQTLQRNRDLAVQFRQQSGLAIDTRGGVIDFSV